MHPVSYLYENKSVVSPCSINSLSESSLYIPYDLHDATVSPLVP